MPTISSGFLRWAWRWAAATDGGASSTRTWCAWSPLRPERMPNSTRVPALSVAVPSGRAEDLTYTSSPSSRDRKPKPLSASYHLTFPVGTVRPFSWSCSGVCEGTAYVPVPAGANAIVSAIALGLGQHLVQGTGAEAERVDLDLLETRFPDGPEHVLTDAADERAIDLEASPVTEVADAEVAHVVS